MAELNRLKSFYEQTGEEPLAPLANEADVEQFFAMQPELTEERPPFPLSPVRDYTRFLTGPAAKPAAKATKAVAAPKPSFEETMQALESAAPSQTFKLGPSALAALDEIKPPSAEMPAATRKPPAVTPEPARAPVIARTADATTGTTTSGIVAPAAPAMDDGKAAKPVVGVGVPSAGAGGDEGIDRTALAEALARGGEAIFRGVTGRALPTGIPEMLAAVRQRREAQAQREREIGSEQARQEQLFSQQRGLKAMEIEAEQAKAERARQFAEADVGRQIDYLQEQATAKGDTEKAQRLEKLRGMAAKGSDVRGLLKTEYDEAVAAAGVKAKEATARLTGERADVVKETAEATADLKRAQAERARFLSSPAGIAAARKVAEKEDAALEQARGGRFAGLGLTPSQQESATRAVAENRQQLSAKTAPFAETITALKNAEAAAAGLKEIKPSDVLKAKLPGGVGESLMSDEAKALQKAQQSLTDLILRARSGAAITEAEANRLTDLYGVKPFRSITDYKKGLKELKSLMYAKLNAAQSGFAPTGDIDVDRYAALEDLERGDPNFVSYRDPFFKDVGGTGKRVGAVAATGAKPRPSAAAIAKLQASIGTEQETSLKQAFDARYGEGAADKALGGK